MPRPSSDVTAPSLRPWQRLAVRLAAAFALLTLLTVVLVGVVIRERHKRELEDTVGTQLLNIARTGALLVDPALHAEVTRTRTSRSDAYVRIREALGAMQQETLLTTPIYTLTDLDPAARRARIMVASDSSAKPGDALALPAELVEPLGWTFEDGVARYTRVYVTPKGKRITAFAPIVDRMGRATAVLTVDYPVDIYLDRLSELDTTIWRSSLIAAVAALILGLLFARRLTRPISALTGAVGRVAAGDLSQTVPVRSRDEVGQLGRAFNEMVTGLRQRDFIRNAFGRYVSPEVAQTLLESPDGLRLGGHKREITVLMSDLRGYTRFAEMGDPGVGHGRAQRLPGPDGRPDHRPRRQHQRVHRRRDLRGLRRAARPTRSRRAGGGGGAGHAARDGRVQPGAPRPRRSALRDGHRPQHRRGRGGQHRLRAAGEVRGGRRRGQPGRPHRRLYGRRADSPEPGHARAHP